MSITENNNICEIQEITGRIRVRLMNATANSLRVSWSFASPVGFNISSFTVSASPITSYLPRPIPIEGTAGDQQREHTLLGLSPATKYNITVWGISYEGNTTKASSLEAWTRIGGRYSVFSTHIYIQN